MAPPRILYVEWYKDSEEALTRLLCDDGYEVITSPTLAESVQLARTEHFDLCLLSEFTADDHTGIELCQLIRAFDHQTPILFYSTQAFAADRAEAINAGAQAYLIKPRELDRLNPVIAGLLKDVVCCH